MSRMASKAAPAPASIKTTRSPLTKSVATIKIPADWIDLIASEPAKTRMSATSQSMAPIPAKHSISTPNKLSRE